MGASEGYLLQLLCFWSTVCVQTLRITPLLAAQGGFLSSEAQSCSETRRRPCPGRWLRGNSAPCLWAVGSPRSVVGRAGGWGARGTGRVCAQGSSPPPGAVLRATDNRPGGQTRPGHLLSSVPVARPWDLHPGPSTPAPLLGAPRHPGKDLGPPDGQAGLCLVGFVQGPGHPPLPPPPSGMSTGHRQRSAGRRSVGAAAAALGGS